MNLRDLPIVDGEEVGRLLPYPDLIDALADGHRAQPTATRRIVFGPDGADDAFLALPAWQPDAAIGVKLVTVFHANPSAGAAGGAGAVRALRRDDR